jgi:PKHD-type hydroxylase
MEFYRLGEVPPIVCDAALFDRSNMQDGKLGLDMHVGYEHRQCKVGFAPQDHWFAGVLSGFGLLSNKSKNWGLDISEYDQIQLATYTKDQHFNWHIDTMVLSDLPLDRKVTVVCLLNNPEEFEGGEFELRLNSEIHRPKLRKGSIIAFPSFISHRVIPVTQGVRHTATLWLTGPKFK